MGVDRNVRRRRTRALPGAVVLPLGLLCVLIAWLVVEHALLRAHLGSAAEAITEMSIGTAAIGLVLVAGLRRERRLLDALDETAASETRFRLLVEEATDGIFLVDGRGRILDANPRMTDMLGYTLDEARGRRIEDFLAAGDAERQPIRWDELRTQTALLSERCMRTRDGREIVVEIHSRILPDGRLQGVMRDVSERAAAERARVATERRLAHVLDQAGIGLFVTDMDGRVTLAEGRAWSDVRRVIGDPVGQSAVVSGALPAEVAETVREAFASPRDATIVEIAGRAYELECSPMTGTDGAVEGVLGVFQDVTERHRLQADQRRLATAVEQATETMLVVDTAGFVVYANPAFARLAGADRTGIIGRHVSSVYDSDRNAVAWRDLEAAMHAGESWTGDLVGVRGDGSTFRQVASVTPVHDGAGVLGGFVAVQRDVTRERELEAALDRDQRELASIIAALERLEPATSPTDTARRICREIARLPGIDHAALLGAEADTFVPLAVEGALRVPVEVGRPLPSTRAAYLLERAALGPWAETWRVRRCDGTFGTRMAEAGMRAAAYVPLRADDRVIGVLAVGTNDARGVDRINELLTALAAFGSLAGVLLAPALVSRGREATDRATIRGIIAAGSFRPVFQPVVDLAVQRPVGYEALTRFVDGTRPDLVFDLAYRVGLGFELEAATIRAAVAAAATLPDGCWLSINVSPAFVLEGTGLAPALGAADRPLILEITEREVVQDYDALRASMARLQRDVRLAVDDAGAGFASLRHVLELHPAAVKLDITLIRAIDSDPARQALVAGMRHFAVTAGCLLIAEGIETPAELRTLRELDVPFGQGYLLGAPASAAPSSTALPPTHPVPAVLAAAGGEDAVERSEEGAA